MPLRSYYLIIRSQKLLNGFDLRGRLHNYKVLSHKIHSLCHIFTQNCCNYTPRNLFFQGKFRFNFMKLSVICVFFVYFRKTLDFLQTLHHSFRKVLRTTKRLNNCKASHGVTMIPTERRKLCIVLLKPL